MLIKEENLLLMLLNLNIKCLYTVERYIVNIITIKIKVCL